MQKQFRVRSMLVAMTIVGVFGCSTLPHMSQDMQELRGQPIGVVVDRLGPPSSETKIEGRHLYTWQHARLMDGTSLDCKIDFKVGARNEILDWQIAGQRGGCEYFSDRWSAMSR